MAQPNRTDIVTLKKLITKYMMVLFLFVMPSFAYAGDTQTQAQQVGSLTVSIVGLESDKGNVKIALFESKERYAVGDESWQECSVTIQGNTVECTFDTIPYGQYAVKVYHDKNENNKLDTNFMGIPKEPYGFSNNARGNLGPAPWDAAKFVFNAKSITIEIAVK